MHTTPETLWNSLYPVLADSANRVIALDPTLTNSIGRSANDAFLLRAYLAFRKHADGDEVAITVDVKTVDDQTTITWDVTCENGDVIANGPSLVASMRDAYTDTDAAFSGWLIEFERFVRASEMKIVQASQANRTKTERGYPLSDPGIR